MNPITTPPADSISEFVDYIKRNCKESVPSCTGIRQNRADFYQEFADFTQKNKSSPIEQETFFLILIMNYGAKEEIINDEAKIILKFS